MQVHFGTPGGIRAGSRGAAIKRASALFPLQVVGSRGEINAIEGGAITSTNQKQVGRSRHFIGTQDVSELRVGFNGFFVDAATSGNFQTCAEINATSPYILRLSVEIGGVVRRLSFNGGASEMVVNPGDLLDLSDAITPAAFAPLAGFTAQLQFWIIAEREYAVGAKAMFHQTASNSPTISGESYFVGATTATSKLDTPGALTTAGGWTQQAHVWLPYAVLGRPVKKMMAVCTFGASIENGVGDGQGDGLNGAGGYMRRMLADVMGKKIARIHLAKSGETVKSFVANSAKRRHMLQYVNHVFSGHGGNDYSTNETLANTEARWSAAWALMKATGAYLEHYALSPKTNGTWTTLEGQTPRIGYEIGGAWRDAGNAWCASKVGTEINAFINLGDAQTSPEARDKWRIDLGVPTTDGTHPAGVIAAAMATANQAHIEALRVAWESA